jgi:hypothetical protein
VGRGGALPPRIEGHMASVHDSDPNLDKFDMFIFQYKTNPLGKVRIDRLARQLGNNTTASQAVFGASMKKPPSRIALNGGGV